MILDLDALTPENIKVKFRNKEYQIVPEFPPETMVKLMKMENRTETSEDDLYEMLDIVYKMLETYNDGVTREWYDKELTLTQKIAIMNSITTQINKMNENANSGSKKKLDQLEESQGEK